MNENHGGRGFDDRSLVCKESFAGFVSAGDVTPSTWAMIFSMGMH